MKKRSICILGGSGFVGRHLATRWINAGHQVRVLTRYKENCRGLLVLPGIDLVQCDVHNVEMLAHNFVGCDTVVNLVGILNESGRNGRGFDRVHSDLSGKVVAACNGTGIKRLLHMSALGADPNGPSHYLRTKGEADLIIQKDSGNSLAWTIFQPSVIFGPEDSFTNRFARLLKLCPGFFPLARPNTRFAPIYVMDVAQAFAGALDNPGTYRQCYQLCGPKVYSLRELVNLIARTSGVACRVVGLPDGIARVQASIMDLVPGKPFSTDNYLSLTVHSICEHDGCKGLGLKPASMESMLPAWLGSAAHEYKLDLWRRAAGRR